MADTIEFPFGGADDDDDTDEGAGTTSGSKDDNKSIKDLRSAVRRAEKAEKAALAELEPLRAFKAERDATERAAAITSAFEEAKLNPTHSKLYAALNPEAEVTADSVRQFATEYGLIDTAGADADVASGAVVQSKGWTPVTIDDGTRGATTVSRAEWLKLAATDQKRAEQLFLAGRVDLSDVDALRAGDRA